MKARATPTMKGECDTTGKATGKAMKDGEGVEMVTGVGYIDHGRRG
jgi:hypothetical protein